MSRLDAETPVCIEQTGAVSLIIRPRSKDLGGFSVRRVLPASERPMVGPFIFVDEMGPAEFQAGDGINVRPHPHIGLATVTYLFEGEILHRDSLGRVQAIEPGAVNLMTAGRGIVHSERTSETRERDGQRLHGMQIWMALPEAEQECAPAFDHYPKDQMPRAERNGVQITLILGAAFDLVSPVAVRGEPLYAELRLPADSTLDIPACAPERALYVVDGAIRVGDCAIERGSMAVLNPGSIQISATANAVVMLFGGPAMGKRNIWWNFVHTDQERIEQAKAAWRDGRFDPVPGDEESIPLPD